MIFPLRPALLAFFATTILAQAGEPAPARTFSHPDRIRYDASCLTIDGRDVFIYSGAFHYFRCPRELWADRFQKIKAAGFNCVETYAAWNWSEPQMPAGPGDFSKVNVSDFDDWLTMAEHYGLYVIVRPGPYICAEWATGGFPQWLLTKKPEHPLRGQGWVRSDDPVYLTWSKHWYDAVCPVIARHQITRKQPGAPGVILVQVENEYNYASFPDEVKINQLRALVGFARADGIEVPLISCLTNQVRGSRDPALRQVFDCTNFYPRWSVGPALSDGIGKLRTQQPDAPLATTEMQAGWFAQIGGMLSEQQDGVNAAQIQNITLYAIQQGDTMINYYMLFGGTNFGDWGARDLITSYDYNAPIREWGGVGDRYQRVWAIGHFLREHGASIARSELVDCKAATTQKDVEIAERKTRDGGRYFFIRTNEHSAPREGEAKVTDASGAEISFHYELEPFGSKIFYLPPGASSASQGQWLPKSAPEIARPQALPAPVKIASATMRDDAGPSQWTALSTHETLAQAGYGGSGFIFYRTSLARPETMSIEPVCTKGDAVLAAVNGTVAPVGGSSAAKFEVPAGPSTVKLLYENRGFFNFGNDIESSSGISALNLVNATIDRGVSMGGWKMQFVSDTASHPEVQPGYDDTNWPETKVEAVKAAQLPAGKTAVFRTHIQAAAESLKKSRWQLTIGRIDDEGEVFLNGTSLGTINDWAHAHSFDVTKLLQAGDNVVAAVVINHNGTGGLGAPAIAALPETVALQAFGQPEGVEHSWWQPGLNDKEWKSVSLGDATASSHLLTWYRMNFALPAPTPGVWVPWHLHLEAKGNGFLYLNGHALGRYWEAGPQHDFFLPECWLNFGAGKSNILALDLRPTEHGAKIEAATVEPYSGFAEKR